MTVEKKVLVVSEDHALVEMVKPIIEKHQCTVLLIAPCGDMLSIIRDERPVLIMLDVCASASGSSPALCREIKSDPDLHTIPILTLMDFTDDVIVKPLEIEILEAKVARLLPKVISVQKKVVIVDDERDLCKTLSFRFQQWGFTPYVAHDGEAGFELITEVMPDLIVLDLKLPKLKGEDVCKLVREDERIDSIPIIMITAKDSPVDKIVGKVIGANEYLTKPFEVSQLFEKVKELVPS